MQTESLREGQETLSARVRDIEECITVHHVREYMRHVILIESRMGATGGVIGDTLRQRLVMLDQHAANISLLRERMRTQDWYRDLSEQESRLCKPCRSAAVRFSPKLRVEVAMKNAVKFPLSSGKEARKCPDFSRQISRHFSPDTSQLKMPNFMMFLALQTVPEESDDETQQMINRAETERENEAENRPTNRRRRYRLTAQQRRTARTFDGRAP